MAIAVKKGSALLKEWQKRLRLQDWTIGLEQNCKAQDMKIKDCSGCCEWIESSKTAQVQILDPMEYGERIVPYDFETTLVHELLHCKLSLISTDVDDCQERYMHQIIDDLAKAFVDAKRYNDATASG